MTSRLRDVLSVTVGAYLCALGALLFANESGWRNIGTQGLVEAGFGLFLIVLGVLAILAEARARRAALEADPKRIEAILAAGAERARAKARDVLDRARRACGLARGNRMHGETPARGKRA